MAEFRLGGKLLDGTVFGLLAIAGLLDRLLPLHGLASALALTLCAYAAAGELCRHLWRREYQVHESMATTLAALVIGFAWYLPTGYDALFEPSRWVELALTLGLMMEALMVCISLIGLFSSRKLQQLHELLLALAVGLAPGLLLVPATLLCGAHSGLFLAVPLAGVLLWAARQWVGPAPRGQGVPGPLAALVLAAVAVTALVAAHSTLSTLGVVLAAVLGVAFALVGQGLYDLRLSRPIGPDSLDLCYRFLAGRVVDRLPGVCLLGLVLFAVSLFFSQVPGVSPS